MNTVVCIASGPSLTEEDCEHVRRSGLYTIAVNSSYMLASFAQVLYAGDRAWWKQYGHEAKTAIKECWTASEHAAVRFSINRFEARDFVNSGYQAIELAILEKKAHRVILLGYDMQYTNGRKHWHEDHPDPLENATSIDQWPSRFREFRLRFPNVEFLNCSRETALTCFRRVRLEDALSCKQAD